MSKNKVTIIDNLLPDKENPFVIDNTNALSLSELVIDLSIPLELRINYIQQFYKQFGDIESLELINRLSSMYQMSGTKVLEKYMYEITKPESDIPIFLKIISAKSLCYFNTKKNIGYDALNTICEKFYENELSTIIKIDAIFLLMTNTSYKIQSLTYFCQIISDIKLECDYRYKTILSLENKNIEDKDYFLKESTLEFFSYKQNKTLYRILSAQFILQKCNPTHSEKEIIENILISFSEDILLDYNLRADSADVILRLGSIENKIKAKDIIMMLGRINGPTKTIFENAQNVHTEEIEDSVLEAIEFLSTIETKTITGIKGSPYINFEYVKKQIDIILQKQKPKNVLKYDTEYKNFKHKKDSINISLNRIYLDRALYSKFNYSLINILLKIWTYICSHKSEIEMKNRLLEELLEMSGTCSSGFVGRLVNVISGFGDFNLRISFRDQIIANFTGRLNSKARDISNPLKIETNIKLYEIKESYNEEKDDYMEYYLNTLSSFQAKVLEEMTIISSDYSNRLHFLKFFRKNMLNIREELYSEFRLYITDTDFDLYFRSAISSYETGDYI